MPIWSVFARVCAPRATSNVKLCRPSRSSLLSNSSRTPTFRCRWARRAVPDNGGEKSYGRAARTLRDSATLPSFPSRVHIRVPGVARHEAIKCASVSRSPSKPIRELRSCAGHPAIAPDGWKSADRDTPVFFAVAATCQAPAPQSGMGECRVGRWQSIVSNSAL